MSELGALSLRFALPVAVLGLAAAIYAGLQKRADWTRVAERTVWIVAGFVGVAMLALFWAFAFHDFSLGYVASHSARSMALHYRLAALWGGQAGSLLLWLAMLLGYSVVCLHGQRHQNRKLMPWVVAVLLANAIFFLVLVNFVTNPFEKLPGAHFLSDGNGLNPLLQHPVMMIHPLMLYMGLVGFVVPFAFGFAALVTGELGITWFRSTRRSTLVAWMFLSIGIMLGGRWAYEVLGWGGYWAWDPVENASFLPWLTATAFLHSVMVQERRGMLKTWNLSLIIGTFLLVLFGTFLTRSGILDSVHAFTEGMIGPIFLAFIALIMVVSLVLIAWRSDRLHAPGSLDAVVSRDSAFILNNLLFVAFTFTVLLGTTFPLIVEAVNGNRVSVGPPYFNMVSIPLGVLLLFLMGVGPALPWRRTTPEKMKRTFLVPALVGLATGLIGFLLGIRSLWPVVTLTFAGFVSATIVEEFRKGVKARMRIANVSAPVALGQILTRNNRRYGGYIVHAGIVVIVVALALSGTYRFEREVTLRQGELMQLGEYGVMFDELWAEEEPQRFVVGGTFSIFHRGDPAGTMQPRMNYYPNSQQPIGTPAVRSTLKEDLYLTLMAFDEAAGSHATVRAIVNPAGPWLWIGGMILALGAILAVMPQRGSGRPAVSAAVIASEEDAAELEEEPAAVTA